MKTGLVTALFGLLAFPSGATEPPPPCAASTHDASAYELGLSLEELYPNYLPDTPGTLPIYGPRFSAPFLGNRIIFQAGYGAADPGTSLFLLQIGYQIPIPTPFFNAFFESGIQYLHYAVLGKNHDMPGVNLGLGLNLPVGKSFALSIALKTYVQERVIVSLGGGFSFLL